MQPACSNMRVDEGKCIISLYDVYRALKPDLISLSDKLVGNNLRAAKDKGGNQKFAEFLQADRRFTFPGGGQGNNTLAIRSRSELFNFVDLLATGFIGPAAVQIFSANKRAFLSKHAQLLDRLWPPVEHLPSSHTSPAVPNKRDEKDYCCPSDSAIQNVAMCFEPALHFAPTVVRGVYTIQVPIREIPTFVTVLGVHTHSSWLNSSATRETNEHSTKLGEISQAQHKRVRYKCLRAGHHRQPSIKTTSADAPCRDKKKQSREFCTTIKCECPAYLSGAYKSSDQTVLLTCDLRHYRHETGTPHDLRLLPLLPDVHEKMDSICRVVREKVLVKRMLKEWVFTEFLPREYPMLKREMILVLDGRFYPSDLDIKNSIAKACKSLRFAAIDQASTVQLFTSKPNLTWALRPATGTHLVYTCSPTDGLRASSVDKQWTVHTSGVVCDAYSTNLSATAMCLYEQHNEGDEGAPRKPIKKATSGILHAQILHATSGL